MACALHLAVYGFGYEIDEALEDLAQRCDEIKAECADTLSSDLPFVFGTGGLFARRLAEEDYDERELPTETVGRA